MLTFILLATAALAPIEDKLQVLTTTPELGDVASQIGGDRVEVTSLLKGPEDAHFVDAKPSFIKAANRADLFIVNGMSLEVGYAPLLVRDSRNAKIQPGAPGYVDASARIRKLELPTGVIDRTMGDVHPDGNPHYMLDPMNGKVVAATIRDALSAADPAHKAEFDARCAKLQRSIDEAMFGPKLLERFSADALSEALAQGTLEAFLKERGALDDLGGWARTMLPLSGKPFVSYHGGALTYFAHRFRLERVGALEPKPGVIPSSAHLAEIIEAMKARGVKAVFYAAYNPLKPVEKVTSETGAAGLVFPHQVRATPAAATYQKQMDALVQTVASGLARP